MHKKEKTYIDISLPVDSKMVVWQGDSAPEIVFEKTIKKGGESNITSIKMGDGY